MTWASEEPTLTRDETAREDGAPGYQPRLFKADAVNPHLFEIWGTPNPDVNHRPVALDKDEGFVKAHASRAARQRRFFAMCGKGQSLSFIATSSLGGFLSAPPTIDSAISNRP